MPTQFSATFVNGAFYPDQPISLPDQSRVQVTIEPALETRTVPQHFSWEEMEQLIRDRPLNSGGLHYTRDELYDRH